jgi:hypothetical protein
MWRVKKKMTMVVMVGTGWRVILFICGVGKRADEGQIF